MLCRHVLDLHGDAFDRRSVSVLIVPGQRPAQHVSLARTIHYIGTEISFPNSVASHGVLAPCCVV